MKMKPEDIEKDNIFKVPENYFEELPGRIQSKIQARKQGLFPEINWQGILKFSVSIAAAALFLIWYFTPPKTSAVSPEPEEILAQVNTDDVIAYLELTDINLDDLIAQTDAGQVELWQGQDDPLLDGLDLNQDQLQDFINTY